MMKQKRVLLAVAALAGAYAVYRKMTAEQRANAKEWLMQVREEVAEHLKPLKDVTEEEYGRIVDAAMYHYGRLYHVNAREFAAAAEDFRSEWSHARENIKEAAKEAAQKTRRSIKNRLEDDE